MKITLELDATQLVRWRNKKGHTEDGRFVVDDLPGEATGPWGKTHGSKGDGRTICGKPIPEYAEPGPDQGILCANCATLATYIAS